MEGTGSRHLARPRQALRVKIQLLLAPLVNRYATTPELARRPPATGSDRRGRPAQGRNRARGQPGERRAGDLDPPQLPTVAEPDHGRGPPSRSFCVAVWLEFAGSPAPRTITLPVAIRSLSWLAPGCGP